MKGRSRGLIRVKGASEGHRKLERLRRRTEEIRDFLVDVYEEPPIGPLLAAYEMSVADLVQEEVRWRLVPRVLVRLATRFKAVGWRDERKLMRVLEGPFETLFVLLVHQVNSGDISPKEAAARWASEISAAHKATGPSPNPLLIDLDSLEAAFAGAASRHDRFTALYLLRRRRRWRR